MMIWMRIALVTVLIISSGSATYASGQPSYIISSSKVPQLNPIKYEIAFVSRFDNRIVVDSGTPGPSVDDVIAGSGTLWDKKGVQIGRFDANTRVSERLNAGDKRLLFVNYSFGDGQDSIVILGVGTYGNSRSYEPAGYKYFFYRGWNGKISGRWWPMPNYADRSN